jgi:hypothetical protein
MDDMMQVVNPKVKSEMTHIRSSTIVLTMCPRGLPALPVRSQQLRQRRRRRRQVLLDRIM